MKPILKLAEIKKNTVSRNPSAKLKNSLQRSSPYGLVSATYKTRVHKAQVSDDASFKPIMVAFLPLSNSEIILKPDY
jgi:hypothetical protein